MNIIAEKRKFEDGDFRIKFKLIVGESPWIIPVWQLVLANGVSCL